MQRRDIKVTSQYQKWKPQDNCRIWSISGSASLTSLPSHFLCLVHTTLALSQTELSSLSCCSCPYPLQCLRPYLWFLCSSPYSQPRLGPHPFPCLWLGHTCPLQLLGDSFPLAVLSAWNHPLHPLPDKLPPIHSLKPKPAFFVKSPCQSPELFLFVC